MMKNWNGCPQGNPPGNQLGEWGYTHCVSRLLSPLNALHQHLLSAGKPFLEEGQAAGRERKNEEMLSQARDQALSVIQQIALRLQASTPFPDPYYLPLVKYPKHTGFLSALVIQHAASPSPTLLRAHGAPQLRRAQQLGLFGASLLQPEMSASVCRDQKNKASDAAGCFHNSSVKNHCSDLPRCKAFTIKTMT